MTLSQSRYNSMFLRGLLLFAVTLPLSKSAGNVLLFLGYLIAAAGMLYYQDFKASVKAAIRQPLMLAFSLYFLVALIGILYTGKYADGFHVANKFFSLPAIYLIVSVLIETVQDPDKRYRNAENILLSFLIGLMLLNGIGVMTYLGIIGNKRFVLPLAPLNVHHIWFSNINALGIYTAAAFLLFSSRGKALGTKLFLILFVLLALICILLSLSRTAWFGIALTSGLLAVLALKKELVQNKKGFFFFTATVLSASVAVYQFVPIVHDRIFMIGNDIAQFSAGQSVTSLGARFLMWKAAFTMFLSNPLAGVGTGDYVPTMTAYVQSGQVPEFLLAFNQPHNMYLFAMATNGLLGLATLLYIYYRALRFALPRIQGDNRERIFAFLAVATAVHFMIAGFFDSFFNIQMLRYTFAFIMGVCIRTSIISVRAE